MSGKLIGIALKLQIALGSIVIVTVLILPIQEHAISLHLFVLSLISFISVGDVCIQVFVSLGRFILKYFILFLSVVNGILSLISLPDILLLLYRNPSDFCVLILYPMTLLSSLNSSFNFLVASLDFFCVLYHVICKQWESSSLIFVARTSKTILNNGKNGALVLFLVLEEILSIFHCWE